MTPENSYTTKQAAEYLQISEWTVRRYLREGVIKGFKLGQGWRIKESELDRLMKGGESSDGD